MHLMHYSSSLPLQRAQRAQSHYSYLSLSGKKKSIGLSLSYLFCFVGYCYCYYLLCPNKRKCSALIFLQMVNNFKCIISCAVSPIFFLYQYSALSLGIVNLAMFFCFAIFIIFLAYFSQLPPWPCFFFTILYSIYSSTAK